MSFFATNGAYTVGSLPKEISEEYMNILIDLSFGNTPASTENMAGLNIFDPMIEDIVGTEGMKIVTTYSTLKFTDDGLATTSPAFIDYKKEFVLKRQGYKIKDFDFSINFITKAIETKTDIMTMARERTNKAIEVYQKMYRPAIKLQTLFTGDSSRKIVPADGIGQDYEYQFGALRGETVSILKPTVSGGTAVRNHWRAIEKNTGVTAEDVQFCSNYIKQYKDYSGTGIICYGNGNTLFQLNSVYNYVANQDLFEIDGLPSSRIAGVVFVEYEWLPDDILIFSDKNSAGMIKHLISPEPTFRGLGLIKETGFDTMNNPEQLSGSLIKIQAEGLIGGSALMAA